MKKITPLFFVIALFACNTAPVTETDTKKDNNSYVWSDDIQTILPLEKDTAWEGSNLTNASANFDQEKLFASIKKAVLGGKIKAYSNYPDKELTLAQASNLLVSWDSTAMAEDPNKPGTFVSAPMKFEVFGWSVPQINFHKTIELDTVTNIISEKISYLTVYIYKTTETGKTIGIKKLFDVKFNEEK